jgi:hypothetical protein
MTKTPRPDAPSSAPRYEDLPRSTQQRFEDELLGRRIREALALLIRVQLLSLAELVAPVIAQVMAERRAGETPAPPTRCRRE